MKAVKITLLLIFGILLRYSLVLADAKRPNFNVIVVDDLSPENFSCCYTIAQHQLNIDRLASTGCNFLPAGHSMCSSSEHCSQQDDTHIAQGMAQRSSYQ